MSAWLVAEIIIWNLPAYKSGEDGGGSDNGIASEDANMAAPLLSNDNGDASAVGNDTPDNTTTYGSGTSTPPQATEASPETISQDAGKPRIVNAIGCLLAIAAIAITGITFYTIFTDNNDDTPS
ncbi:MAG: hypothetical protein SGILL_009961 [Bacillariaceae sp.]